MPEWTIRALMDWTERHFQQKGIESPRLETQLLLSHALECRKTELYTRWDDVVTEDRRARFRDLIKRRLDGAPIQHLIGYREFFLLTFEVSPAVLIPRPETELLVSESIRRIKAIPSPRVLDVGTGSGCIALSIAQQCPTAHIVATDISPAALEVARRNAAKHGLTDRVDFRQGDLFDAVRPDELFHVIVSNPPYISNADYAQLPAHIREHEPREALLGGEDGFLVFDRLIPGAKAHLEAGGWLLMEIGSTQETGVNQRLADAGFAVCPTVRDDQRLPRVAIGQSLLAPQ